MSLLMLGVGGQTAIQKIYSGGVMYKTDIYSAYTQIHENAVVKTDIYSAYTQIHENAVVKTDIYSAYISISPSGLIKSNLYVV